MIDAYDFGRIIIAGETYHTDVIIYPERVNGSWWRKQSHNICLEDIAEILTYRPEALIIGQGRPGRMKVPDTVIKRIEEKGITVSVMPTEKAVMKYNDLSTSKRVVAALHLTC